MSNIRVHDLGSGEARNPGEERTKKMSIAPTSNPFCGLKQDFIKKSKSTLSPDNEAAKVTTRSELEEVQSPHIDLLNTGQVAECLDNTIVLIIHNKGTTVLMVPTVPHLSFPSMSLQELETLTTLEYA